MSKTLNECCFFQEGYVNPPQDKKEYFNGNIKWLRSLDLNNSFVYETSRTLTEKGYNSAGKSAYMFPANTIAISKSGTVGELGILKDTMCGNRAIIDIQVDGSKADLLYVFYLLRYKKKEIISKAVGSIQKNLYCSALGTIELCHDDINEQKRISGVLGSIDEKIRNNNTINDELETMARTIYNYWFLQFEFPNENGKPYKSSGGKMVWNEELKRDIPDGWKPCHIRNCIKHINTGLNPRDNFKLGKGSIRYITVKNLTTNGTIDFTSCDVIDEEARAIVHRRSDVSKGDILFASIAPLGRCVIVQENPVDWDINESVFSIRPDTDKVSTEHLYMFFMSDYFIKKAEHNSTGSVFSGIRVGTLEDMYILLPPPAIRDKFKSAVADILYKKYLNDQENQELASLRDFLLPLLMNGQVTFKGE